ncbi:putative RNA-binding protein eif1ad [Polyrhizophydium stewartii]|uniref:RNA-binding protein eif1ad n=1 Tax=Polyrhizophydium stewartii TaxID=2732419 RepID=A0ABR4NHA6_9FUNG
MASRYVLCSEYRGMFELLNLAQTGDCFAFCKNEDGGNPVLLPSLSRILFGTHIPQRGRVEIVRGDAQDADQAALETQPEPSGAQRVAKVLEVRGGGLYVVAAAPQAASAQAVDASVADESLLGTPCSEVAGALQVLVVLPAKFQKLIWVKKGNFVIVDPTPASKTKVKGEIAHILFPENIKHIKAEGLWPSVFDDDGSTGAGTGAAGGEGSTQAGSDDPSSDNGGSDDDDLFVNRNHGGYSDDEDD